MFQNMVATQPANVVAEAVKEQELWPLRILAFFSGKKKSAVDIGRQDDENKHRVGIRGLRTDMIRRIDSALMLVDPNGLVSEEDSQTVQASDLQVSVTPSAPSCPLTSDTTYVTIYQILFTGFF